MSVNASWPEMLGTAAAIVAIAGGALALCRGAMAWYRRTIGSRRILTAHLNQLAAGVTLRWVEERLGPPTFVGRFGIRPQISASTNDEPSALRELIYRTKHAWIQIIADEHDTVGRFSITVTDPRFRFEVRDLTFYHLHARLGHSRFSDLRPWAEPDGRSLNIAARRREYAESYWFGNPGNYQRYVLSHNDAGTGKFYFNIQMLSGPGWCQEGFLEFDNPPPVTPPPFDPDAPYARQFRAGTIINTLTVLGPLMPASALAAPRGPDADHVRVLVPDVQERRRLRRRVRRTNRQVEREIRRQAEGGGSTTSQGHNHDTAAS
jgi:hypothetical protein